MEAAVNRRIRVDSQLASNIRIAPASRLQETSSMARSAPTPCDWSRGGDPGKGDSEADLLLVCSTGGHLYQLVALSAAWEGLSRAWVTFDKSDARSLLTAELVYAAHGPTNRNVKNLLRNLPLAWRILRRVRPRAVVTTGAGVAVPFAWLGRLTGARVVYVESFTRIDGPSLSCKLIKPVADRVYVQWPELAEVVGGSRYRGNLFVGT
jgi:UDP-N-acetylglucosamine:LPS N-acetylglucosamine transferase